MPTAARIVPPAVRPPEEPLGRIAFISRYVRNPLSVVPREAYEEDFLPVRSRRGPIAWVTAPSMIRAILLEER
jgi:hypothetical protein